MSYKNILTAFFVLIFLSALFLTLYSLVQKSIKKRLGRLENESRTAAEITATPSPTVKRITLPSQLPMEKNGSLYLQTDKSSFSQGEFFYLKVMADAKGEKTDGVEFVLSFDPKMVRIGDPVPGNFFFLYPQKKVDSQEGIVKVMALQNPNDTKPLNDAIVVSLLITTLQKGQASFDFVKDKNHLSGYAGKELLQATKNLTITIE